MDILEIRTLLRTKPIYDIPMRVTFYARVSSDSDEQLNSLDNQISLSAFFASLKHSHTCEFRPLKKRSVYNHLFTLNG